MKWQKHSQPHKKLANQSSPSKIGNIYNNFFNNEKKSIDFHFIFVYLSVQKNIYKQIYKEKLLYNTSFISTFLL